LNGAIEPEGGGDPLRRAPERREGGKFGMLEKAEGKGEKGERGTTCCGKGAGGSFQIMRKKGWRRRAKPTKVER